MTKVSVDHPPFPGSMFTKDGYLSLEAQYFCLNLWNRTGGSSDYIDQLLGRVRHIAIAVTGDVTMSSETDSNSEAVEGRYYFLEFTGTPGTATDVNFSDIEGNYLVWNNTDSVLTFKTVTDTTGIAVAVGRFDLILIESSDYSVRNLQHVTQASVLGATAAGPTTEITLNATLEFNSGALRRAALTGEVTSPAGSNALTVNPGGLVTPDATDKFLFQDTTDDDSLQYSTPAALAGLLDHGTLTGLSDDDHTQYLLADGSRNATVLKSDTFFDTGATSGITASTTQNQGEQPLTTSVNEVSTCANTNDVVTLPTAVAGREVTIINNGAQTLQIFPATDDDLGAGVDTSTTLAAGSFTKFLAYDTTNWIAII